METSKKHLVLVAGEASGDLHAAHLVDALKTLDPTLSFSGLGGAKMRESGVEIYYELAKQGIVGFGEVVKHYPQLKKAFHLILKKIDQTKPVAVILVDYPGFNLRLARELKKRKIKVIYYISPQIWAWKENRVGLIKEVVDRMLVLFEFEQKLYAKHGIDVFFAGHPLVDTISIKTSKAKFLEQIGFSDYKLTIGLLPGSREKEVERHLPIMLEAALILNKEFPMIQFLIIKAPTISPGQMVKDLDDSEIQNIKLVGADNYAAINACDLCMVASGTATLETALLRKPMVVVYKTSLLTWSLAKLFIKIPYIGLVNIMAGKQIVPECLQFQATGGEIAQELKNIFTNEPKLADIKYELEQVKKSLGPPGASERAAKEILRVVSA